MKLNQAFSLNKNKTPLLDIQVIPQRKINLLQNLHISSNAVETSFKHPLQQNERIFILAIFNSMARCFHSEWRRLM